MDNFPLAKFRLGTLEAYRAEEVSLRGPQTDSGWEFWALHFFSSVLRAPTKLVDLSTTILSHMAIDSCLISLIPKLEVA